METVLGGAVVVDVDRAIGESVAAFAVQQLLVDVLVGGVVEADAQQKGRRPGEFAEAL